MGNLLGSLTLVFKGRVFLLPSGGDEAAARGAARRGQDEQEGCAHAGQGRLLLRLNLTEVATEVDQTVCWGWQVVPGFVCRVSFWLVTGGVGSCLGVERGRPKRTPQ